MAKASRFAYTTLTGQETFYLEVDMPAPLGKQRFAVSQYSGSFALNSIPVAQCTIALGRNVRTLELAPIHKAADKLTAMFPARVVMQIKGQFMPEGAKNSNWPTGSHVLFEGYYVGFSYQKHGGDAGSVYFVAHLSHWLQDLTFTSMLSSVSHPTNAANLAYPAVHEPTSGGTSGSQSQPVSVATLIPDKVANDAMKSAHDVWDTMRTVLCALSTFEGFDPELTGGTIDNVDIVGITEHLKLNSRAAKALARIEGKDSEGVCASGGGTARVLTPYKYSKPLQVSTGLNEAFESLASAICELPLAVAAYQTMWDCVIGYYMPQFQLDLCPMSDRAIVVAKITSWVSDKYWRTITADEYTAIDQTAMLAKPLRAVVCHGTVTQDTYESDTNAGIGQLPAGRYVSPGIAAGDPDGGAVLYQGMPDWVKMSLTNDDTAKDSLNPDKASGDGAGTVPPKTPTSKSTLENCEKLLSLYAKSVFLDNVLRGRTGNFAGILRFDLAPGAHVKIEGSPELHSVGIDVLAQTVYGRISRVTVQIDAEAKLAATAYTVTGVRNDAENFDDSENGKPGSFASKLHPFYGENITAGAPLVPSLELTP